MQDHYFILQIHQDASAEEIQRAYRTLALRYHPDRNTAPDAAAQMAAINEAYEVLRDRARRKAYDGRRDAVNPNTELVTCVLQAARDVILRAGWTVLQDGSETLLLGKGKQRARVIFVGRLTNELIRKLARQHQQREPMVVLAVSIEGSIQCGPQTAAIDLMRGACHGAALRDDPDGLFKPLLAGFL